MRARELLANFIKSFRRHSVTVMLSLVVLSGLYGLFAIGAMASFNLQDLMARWGNQIELTAYLADTISPARIPKLLTEIQVLPDLKGVQFITKDEARRQFRDHVAGYAPDLVKDPEFENVFPASFVIKLDSGLPLSEIKSRAGQLRSMTGIAEVNYGQEWITNFKHFSSVLQRLGLVLLAILGLAGFFVIGNLQRMTIAERAEEIEIMELIGATPQRIRAPFLFQGAALGFLAAAIGIVGCAGLFQLQARVVAEELPFLDVFGSFRFFSWYEVMIFCFFGLVFGYIGSWIATRHMRDSWFTSRQKSKA